MKENKLESKIFIESAGTGGWHVGEPPHDGTLDVLSRHGIDASAQRAQKLSKSDFKKFKYIIAMDASNVSDIERVGGYKVPRLLDFAPKEKKYPNDVPDPYYTGNFDYVFELVDCSCRALLEDIRAKERL